MNKKVHKVQGECGSFADIGRFWFRKQRLRRSGMRAPALCPAKNQASENFVFLPKNPNVCAEIAAYLWKKRKNRVK